MKLSFTKMHGCGNDFVLIDATGELQTWRPNPEEAAFLLDRHFGIGGDQLLILYPSESADARMAIFNPDGAEVEMCGNGIRCCTLYMARHGLTKKTDLRIETLAGLVRPVIEDECVRVDMGAPILDAARIPVQGFTGRVIDAPPPDVDSDFALPLMSCVSMGNPHAVFFVDDVRAVPLEGIGEKVETHSAFPRRTNVEFAQVLDRTTVRVRVWERGTGITLACGTGACGTVVAGILTGKLDAAVTVLLDGGELTVEWPDHAGHVWMTGPAAEVFGGAVDIRTSTRANS